MKALLFDIDHFNLSELEKMEDKELLALAEQSQMLDYTTRVITKDQFIFEVNSDRIDLNNNWLFIV